MICSNPKRAGVLISLLPAICSFAQSGSAPLPTPQEQVTVTASRSALSTAEGATDTRVVTHTELQQAPGFALDDSLRQVPGFELYRRTSSWVANPGTQGISLRGLGSTAASRTLVLSDEVPFNDPFGGYVHWDEIPRLAVRDVEVMRGGASDLYGSSAIGGVINVFPAEPGAARFVADGGYGGLDTPFGDVLATDAWRQWSALVASSFLRTDGYILTAPAFRGSVDIPYNVHDQSGRVEVRRAFGWGDAFVRGNVLNEARNNGTPLQTNATRLWRYVGGADWVLPHEGRAYLRLYGSDQGYRQSYSAIAPNRDSERLTDLQRVPSQELGLASQWAQTFAKELTLVAGVDVHDVRADDDERPVAGGVVGTLKSTTARQRDTGGYGEALWEHRQWSAALSGRVDRFRSFDAMQFAPARTLLPGHDETMLDWRLGVVRRLPHTFALDASVYRAFRGPTLNELYRNSQVGQIIELGNPLLRSERATGWEAGVVSHWKQRATLHASYFWTEVNRPVSFVDLFASATTVTEQRQNLGQIRSQGLSLDVTAHPLPWLEASGGYQFADAIVTQFTAEPSLVGNWLPEVARNTGSVQVRATSARLGTLNLIARDSGRVFDDSENTLLLHGYFRLDAYYEHAWGRHATFYGSVQNLLDRNIDAGRTPVLTLATPRVAMGGLRVQWGQ